MRRTVSSIAILSLWASGCGGDDSGAVDSGSESSTGQAESSTGPSMTSTPADTSAGETTAATGSGGSVDGTASSGSTTGNSLCGNGDLDDGEDCDDGNTEDGDACRADCTFAFEIAWEVIYNGPQSNNDSANDVVVDADDNIYVLGSERVTDQGSNLVLRQYLADGSDGWSFTYDGADSMDDAGLAMTRTAEGDFIITGYTESNATGEDILLMRVAADGSAAVWSQTFDGPGFGPNENDDVDEGYDVTLDADGNIIVTGEIRVGSLDWDAWIAQYTPDGDEVWTASWAGDAGRQDFGRDLYVAEDGSINVLASEALPANEAQTRVLVYDDAGMADAADPVVLDMIGRDWAFRDDGSRLVSGSTADFLDALLQAYDDAWTAGWMYTIDDPSAGADAGLGLAVGSDGTIVQVGESQHAPLGYNAFVVAYTSDGTPIWSDTYSDDDNDFDQSFRAVAIDSVGDVIVVGYGVRMGEQANIVVRKYHPL